MALRQFHRIRSVDGNRDAVRQLQIYIEHVHAHVRRLSMQAVADNWAEGSADIEDPPHPT